MITKNAKYSGNEVRMGFLDLFFTATALSMDAFAVALLKGLTLRKARHILTIALFFGGFQALMPFLGWLLGQQWEQVVVAYDHWIAFVLLSLIGGKMIVESLKEDGDSGGSTDTLRFLELLLLSVATSIDALAVGVTFAFLRVDILSAVALIGVTTFTFSASGVVLGRRVGEKMRKKAGIFGGAALILIGVKILVEHLGVL